jgi:large subunit ribosomal protein L4
MPKKMRRLALRCVLSAKARDGELTILEALSLDEPKTREMVRILETLKVDSTALIVTSETKTNVVKSARNLPGINTRPASVLNVLDILSNKALVMEVGAVRKAEELWGEESAEDED